jgi:hypothetical protein
MKQARLLALLIFPIICFAQPASQIKTRRQAEKFIKDNLKYHYEYKYDSFKIDSTNSTYDQFKEGDFNHDGLKDLLIFGTAYLSVQKMSFKESEVIMLMGDKSKPRKVNFPMGFFSRFASHAIPYPRVIEIGQGDFIQIGYEVTNHRQQTTKLLFDTVEVRNDHVISFTKKPSERRITKIDFKTDHCFGTCPVFELSIDGDLNVDYNGIDHVDKKGEHKLKAERKDWDYLSKLIANIRIEDLNSSYRLNWTDQQTGFLTVTFGDGEKKGIEDYGLSGTFGLTLLYSYLLDLIEF